MYLAHELSLMVLLGLQNANGVTLLSVSKNQNGPRIC